MAAGTAENDAGRGQKRNRSKNVPFGMRQRAAKRRAHWAELLDDGDIGPRSRGASGGGDGTSPVRLEQRVAGSGLIVALAIGSEAPKACPPCP